MHHSSDIKYGEASLRVREHFASKIKQHTGKNVTDHGLRFIKLTKLIPNWEIYLTDKQREVALKYVLTNNAHAVDTMFKFTYGTTHQRLFGGKTSKGALGRLEKIYKNLETQNVHSQEVKIQKKKNVISSKNLQSIRELIKLAVDIPDYVEYLTNGQVYKLQTFMTLRSLKMAAEHCGIKQQTLKRILIGENGILEKLKQINTDRTIDSWEEI